VIKSVPKEGEMRDGPLLKSLKLSFNNILHPPGWEKIIGAGNSKGVLTIRNSLLLLKSYVSAIYLLFLGR